MGRKRSHGIGQKVVIAGKDAFSSTMTANWRLVEDYRYLTIDPNWVAESDAAEGRLPSVDGEH
jgi:hypothetical protein